MSLRIYIGPMFAGKSTVILGLIRRNTFIKKKTMCITSSLDSRASNAIKSHDNDSYPATATAELMPMLKTAEFHSANTIVIEEAQFFPDLKAFVLTAVDDYRKELVVVGLDGDSSRKPFGQILDIIPFCDSVQKLSALCIRCGDGTPAIFTSRNTNQVPTAEYQQILVGTSDLYEPVCRKHFYLNT
jgi:thymidine kinase